MQDPTPDSHRLYEIIIDTQILTPGEFIDSFGPQLSYGIVFNYEIFLLGHEQSYLILCMFKHNRTEAAVRRQWADSLMVLAARHRVREDEIGSDIVVNGPAKIYEYRIHPRPAVPTLYFPYAVISYLQQEPITVRMFGVIPARILGQIRAGNYDHQAYPI